MSPSAKTVPPPQIPLAFVASALLTLGTTLAWNACARPQPLAVLHALVVGVFLTIAMGLLYQFVPVVAMAELRLRPLAYMHLVLAVCGTAMLVTGFERLDFAIVALGGLAHLCGALLEVIVLFTTVRHGKPPAAARGAALSLLWLVLTLGLGIYAADGIAGGDQRSTLAGHHAVFGLAGFFGTLISAVTFRLLRMFERVDRESRTAYVAIGTSIAAALSLAGRIGSYALLAMAVTIGLDVISIARMRNPAYQRETLCYAAVSAIGALAAACSYLAGAPVQALVFAVWFYIGTAVVGYLQRIVPFIWWIRRSRKEGSKNIPTLAQMNATRLGYAILALWTAAGIAYLLRPDAPAGAALGLAAWAALLLQLARPFRLRSLHGV
ncbi:MAG: hypothetical protein ACXWNK_08120 [Vulcanimicrobiaceae bacterium]